MIETGFFLLLAAVSIVTAILVIIQRNAVTSAIYLIINFFSLAGIYLMLTAQFIAVIQVLVYAGAIMVLFLFVIMLLNLGKEKFVVRHILQKVFGVLFGISLLALIGLVFRSVLLEGNKGTFSPEKVAALGNTEIVARLLFTDFLLPFEITSILLLVAMIGAIVLAKKELN